MSLSLSLLLSKNPVKSLLAMLLHVSLSSLTLIFRFEHIVKGTFLISLRKYVCRSEWGEGN